MNTDISNINRKEEEAQLNNVRIIFDGAVLRDPPVVWRSEIDTLIIGLTGIKNDPFLPKLSPKAEKVLKMLEEKAALMKKKKRKFLPIKEN